MQHTAYLANGIQRLLPWNAQRLTDGLQLSLLACRVPIMINCMHTKKIIAQECSRQACPYGAPKTASQGQFGTMHMHELVN
eukprot:364496-Chlamydomonas_euryale.AAC.22